MSNRHTRKDITMSLVAYNQTGYSGASMSNRAVAAYECGEMPKSKWTKTKMLEVINAFCDSEDLIFTASTMKKDELFINFFSYSGWHHTSKFCNETEFYELDEDDLCSSEYVRPMTQDELNTRQKLADEHAAKVLIKNLVKEIKHQIERDFKNIYGYEMYSWKHLHQLAPELASIRITKKGKIIYEFLDGDRVCSVRYPEESSWRIEGMLRN